MPSLDIEIFDEDWNPLPHDGETVGELCIKGPWIASEYYNDPQPDKFHDGWLVTGDVAKIDSEQYVMIADRSKDLIKSGGEWISSVDLENHIVAMSGVAQAAVVARPHPKWDERPLLFLITKDGNEIEKQEINDFLLEKVVKWWLPDDIIFVKELPHGATGKLLKVDLREKYKEHLMEK